MVGLILVTGDIWMGRFKSEVELHTASSSSKRDGWMRGEGEGGNACVCVLPGNESLQSQVASEIYISE